MTGTLDDANDILRNQRFCILATATSDGRGDYRELVKRYDARSCRQR